MSATNKPKQKCVGCKNALPQKENIGCSICKSKYDLLCANISLNRFQAMDLEHKRIWKCPQCQSKQPKTDNKNTPLRAPVSDIDESPDELDSSYNVTQRRKPVLSSRTDSVLLSSNTQSEDLNNFSSELRATRLEMCQFRNIIAELTEALNRYDARVDKLEARIQVLESKINEGYGTEIQALESTVDQLKREVQDRDQTMLNNDIEIAGIPETAGEGTIHIVLSVAAKVGIGLDERDIVHAERVGLPRGYVEGEPAPRPRPIAVRVTRRHIRDSLLRAARVRRGVTTADLGIAGTPRPFYVNERLTKYNRQLFQKAREIAARAKWRFVWTRDGKVYVRRENGSERQRLRSEADLKKVFGVNVVSSDDNVEK